jgi:predicted dehydrogenase
MKQISVVLAGIGGYGAKYVENILRKTDSWFRIAGVVDPYPEKSTMYSRLKDMDIPIFKTLKEFYQHKKADLAIISSPIHYHCEQTCEALENGSNVLCEKPAAATVQEIKEMIYQRERHRKLVAVGFQWAYDPVFLKLKQDVIAGKFGAPLRLKALVLWPRDIFYYKRTSWAGRLIMNGKFVLDSVANNATSHFLHAMLFLIGNDLQNSITPKAVEAELYRVNKIESFDTCCMKIKTLSAEIMFYASHAVNELWGPQFAFDFEGAKIVYNDPEIPESQGKIIAIYKNRKEIYGPVEHGSMRKLWVVMENLGKGRNEPVCTLESALSQTLVINGAHESSEIIDFPEAVVKFDKDKSLFWVKGLSEFMKSCFEKNKLFSEMGISWAKHGRKIELDNYEFFKGGTK